jgi:hypothetical protein
MAMVKKILLLSGFALNSLLSAGDPESKCINDRHNISGMFNVLKPHLNNFYNEIEKVIDVEFKKACDNLERGEHEFSQDQYVGYLRWLRDIRGDLNG